MKHLSIIASLFFCMALTLPLYATNHKASYPAWTAQGFKMPESVEYDKHHDRYYVSNVNDGIASRDNNGSIGLIDGHGQVIAIDWVSGLHSPKGLALHGNRLYVADVGELVVINVDTEKVIARYEALDSKVLNGISINKLGQVFVSDWAGNAIYSLENGELVKWLSTTDLNSPNGLWATKRHLYVASWGANPKPDFTTDTSGNIKKISLETKRITTIDQGDEFINMDGIAKAGKKTWLISDFIKGEIVRIQHKNRRVKTIQTIVKTNSGAADFYYQRRQNLVIVPNLMDGSVSAFQLPSSY